MTTYTWQINGLQVLQSPEPNTVVFSNFTLIGVDGDYTSSVTYTVELLPPNPENFIPLNQITQEQAILWTQEALGPDRILSMEQEVQVAIDASKIPQPEPVPLPWQNN